VITVPAWRDLDWLVHGFGERADGAWISESSRAWVSQVHGADVRHALSPGPRGEADALIADIPGVTVEIRTADCLPVLLLDRARRRVAAVHAGWRGVVAEIVPAAVAGLGGNLEAAIGPGIGVCCFEVGPEVSERFGREGRVHVDLAAIVREQLRRAGVSAIHDLTACTKCDAARFHSYRRDGQAAGRLVSGIGLR